VTEEFRLRLYQFDAQAFLASARDIKGFEFAALDALPHGLSRNAQTAHGLVHGEVIGRRLVTEASAQFVRESNTPWRADGELFSSDGAVIESAMDGRWRHTETGGGFPDRHQLSLGRFGRWPKAWDFPMTAQIADSVGVKTMTICAGSALPVENAGDDSVRIMSRQTPHERDRILVCPHDGWPQPRQIERRFGESAVTPAQG